MRERTLKIPEKGKIKVVPVTIDKRIKSETIKKKRITKRSEEEQQRIDRNTYFRV